MRFVEYCCEVDSALCAEAVLRGIDSFRVTKESANYDTPEGNATIDLEIGKAACALWGSLPCTDWSCWQYYNLKRLGRDFAERLRLRRNLSRRRLREFIERADQNLAQGGLVGFEWPENCSGWKLP